MGMGRSGFSLSLALFITTGVMGVTNSGGAQTPLIGWVDRYDGPAHDNDYGEAVTSDANGNVFVAGFTFEAVPPSLLVPRFLTIKYGPDGTRLWTRTYTTGSVYGSAYRVASDSAGAVIVSGIVQQSDWAVVKYDASGNQQWVRSRDASNTAMTGPSDLAIGSDDSVYVSGFDSFATLTKYNAAGTEQWTRQHTAAPSAFESIAIDASDNVYAAGLVSSGTLSNECLLIRYNSAGTTAWVRTFGTPGVSALDGIARVEIAPDQSVIVTGTLGGNTAAGTDVFVRRYDAAGNLLWSQTLGITPNRDDTVFGLAVAGDGGISLGGSTTNASYAVDTLVARYTLAGSLEWNAVYGGPDADWCRQIAHDAAGGIYAAGVRGIGSGAYEYQCVRFTPAGEQVWEQIYADSTYSSVLTGLAVGPDNRVTVTGRSYGIGGMDAATVQYLQVDAEVFIRGDASGDGMFDIADPIVMLAHLFGGVPTLCLAAHDVTGDDLVDVADPVAALDALFGAGTSIPAPFPHCGIVPSAELLGCDAFAACP
jgi:uncharacterized delta-60 repeat protein